MKITKGVWIGLIVATLWMAGVALSFFFCKWNPSCGGNASGIVCTILAWIFFVPAVIGVTSVGYVLKIFGLPPGFGIDLIAVIIFALLLGTILGALAEKWLIKIRTKTPSNPPPPG